MIYNKIKIIVHSFQACYKELYEVDSPVGTTIGAIIENGGSIFQ